MVYMKNKDSTETMLNTIEDTYVYLLSIVDDINKDLEQRVLEYIAVQEEIQIAIKQQEPEYNIIQLHDLIEEHNQEFLEKLTNKQLVVDCIMDKIDKIESNMVTTDTLQVDNKPAIFRAIKKYNQLILEEIYNDNPYLVNYMKQREVYYSFISSIELIHGYKILVVTQDDNLIKYNTRLRISYEDLKEYLTSLGFEIDRRGNTSHVIWKNAKTGISIPLADKAGTVPQGTVARILNQVSKTRLDITNYLYS